MKTGAVLIVDDEPIHREVVTSCMDAMGFESLVAASGDEAVPYLERDDIDVILTDLKMPGMDGLSLAEKALSIDPGRPVILMTAYTDLENLRRSIKVGIYDYLAKPYHIADLMRVVRRAFDHRQLVVRDRLYQRNLERVVAERTEELEKVRRDLLLFKQGIERSGEIIFLTDIEGKILYVNPAFEKIYGYSLEEVTGRTPRILKSGEMPTEVYKRLWDTLLARQVVAGSFSNRTKDGRLLHVEASANPILDDKGELIGFLAIQREVTDRRRLEEARDLTERSSEGQQALSLPSDRLRSLGEMAAGIAHELSQSLAGLRDLSEHLLKERGREVTEGKVKEPINIIEEQAERITRLLEQIRMLAQEAEKPELRRTEDGR